MIEPIKEDLLTNICSSTHSLVIIYHLFGKLPTQAKSAWRYGVKFEANDIPKMIVYFTVVIVHLNYYNQFRLEENENVDLSFGRLDYNKT